MGHLTIAREIGDRHSEGYALFNLGLFYAALGDAHKAITCYKQVLSIAREIGDRRSEGNTLINLGHVLINTAIHDQHTGMFQQAVMLFSTLGNRSELVAARAGLAHALHIQGDLPGALAQVDLVLEYLETGRLDGFTQPAMRAYLCCYEVLHAAGDPRAQPLLERAYTELMAQAESLDEADRQMFLENVPWNRAIVEAMQDNIAVSGD